MLATYLLVLGAFFICLFVSLIGWARPSLVLRGYFQPSVQGLFWAVFRFWICIFCCKACDLVLWAISMEPILFTISSFINKHLGWDLFLTILFHIILFMSSLKNNNFVLELHSAVHEVFFFSTVLYIYLFFSAWSLIWELCRT